MKSILCALGLMVLVSGAAIAQAATVSWTGNPEPDVEKYKIYACFTRGCVVQKTPEMLHATVPHLAAGTTHTSQIDTTNREGNAAISAIDFAQNESGLSVSGPFDKAAPSIPVTPTVQ